MGERVIGKTLNHYRIVSRLGKGGMGEVYAAEDTKLGRKVALKILPVAMGSNPDRRARFEREAKAVAALNHPNLVTIHSVEEADGLHFITMELVEGKPLSALIGKRGLPLVRILSYGAELAGAVGAAHERRIIHRDLKPDNVMIGDDGRLRVLDFGLAKLKEEATAPPGELSGLATQTPTEEGHIVGTVAYMSPEQAEGKDVDARSDIFSLGVLLYEMATGRRPFRGDTNISTISSILRDAPPSITDLNPELPRHLSRIVSRCLGKTPERRYQTAIDLRNELEGLKEEIDSGEIGSGEVVPTKARATRARVLGIAVAAALVVAGAIATVWMLPIGSDREPAGALQAMEMKRLTDTGTSRAAAISPDGRYFAHVVRDTSGWSLMVTQISTGSSVRIVDVSELILLQPAFSPDGEQIYYRQRRAGIAYFAELFVVPVLGGVPRLVAEDADSGAVFDTTRGEVLLTRGDLETGDVSLVAIPVRGGPEREVFRSRSPAFMTQVSISPDGEKIAAVILEFGMRGRVELFSASGEPRGRLGSGTWFGVIWLAWLPDGSGLLVVGSEKSIFSPSQIFEMSYPDGKLRRVTNDLNNYLSVDLTRDGEGLVTVQREESSTLWRVSTDGKGEPVPITRGARRRDGLGIDWTPDGRIVHAASADRRTNIWIVDADGGHARQLTHDEESFLPAVCGDPAQIVFSSSRGGGYALWRMGLDGSGISQVTEARFDLHPRCDGDGAWIHYMTPFPQGAWKVNMDGGEPVQILDDRANHPVPSPDGTRIALQFENRETFEQTISLLDAAEGALPRPVEGMSDVTLMNWPGDSTMAWSPDGVELYFVRSEEGADNVWAIRVDGEEMRRITSFDEGTLGSLAVSPDGKEIAFARVQTISDVVLIENFR